MILLAAPALAEKRIALVIGNSDYEVKGWDLANPGRDADLIAGKLRSVGFEVHTLKDATEDEMEDAFVAHGERLRRAGSNAIGFFYYAGHGVESRGYNYLAPVDMVAYKEQDVWARAPRLGLLTDALKSAGNNTNFIVLDACRNNPLPSANRKLGGGLAQIKSARGMLIAYSTQPGAVADDGSGLRNSPFTEELSRLITQKGLSVESLFRRVATAVEIRTNYTQQPWYESGLRGSQDFCFAGCAAQAVLPSDETSALGIALASGELARLEEFKKRFPNSKSRGLIDQQIEQLAPEWARGLTGKATQAAKECLSNNYASCVNLGFDYDHGTDGAPENLSHARTLYKLGCNGGIMTGCSNLGIKYQNGLGVPKDEREAYRLNKIACDGGNLTGCGNLGWQYAFGEGVVEDDSEANRLMNLACEGNHLMSCVNLGWQYENGFGTIEDDSRANQLYKKACDGGLMNGCSAIGIQVVNGQGTLKDIAKGRALLQQGCDGGHQWGCDKLKELDAR